MSAPLYEVWRQVVYAHRGEIAVHDLAALRRWSFDQLAAEVEPGAGHQGVCFPSGSGVEFVLAVLRGWRFGQVICPLEPGQLQPEIQERLPESIVHLKTTSASTGAPRLVALTASQLKADADNIVDTMGLRADWPNLGVISLAHSYGFSNLVLPLLLHGIPLVLVPSGLPEIIRAAAGKERAVTIPAVPALWRTWFEAEAIPRNTKLAISAGAPLTLDLEQKIFARDGLKIHNFYGSSECGGIAYDATQVPRSESACVGSPMRNVEVRVGSGGCIEVLGAAVAETYWPEPGPALNGGVFRTSDLGEVKDGLVFLHGRVSDQINVAGRKVAPEIIERALATHPQVRACLAFGIPADARRGESIVACIAASEALTETALRQYALSRLPAWQVPRHWWFIDELEANERGKISRAEWRRRYLERASPSR